MTKSLIDGVRQTITPSVISQLSGEYRESTPAVEKGLMGATAALLGAIAARSADRGFMGQLFSLVTEPAVGGMFDTPERVLEQAHRPAEPGGLLDRIQSLAFGNRGPVVEALARYAGLSTSAASSLTGAAAALILGHLIRLVRQDRLDPAALARRFADERASINGAVPGPLASLTALGTSAAASRPVPPREPAPVVPVHARGYSPLAWVAGALLGAIALFGLYSLLKTPELPPVASVRPREEVGTSGYVTRTLPDRSSLRFPASGMEGRLLNYIETASPGNREEWFELDRVTFEADSAILRPSSRDQLANLAMILRSHPRVRVKIGGYTDNTGDPATNLRLSQARAGAVASELRMLGIEGDRIVAEGYGDQHPLADNATPEGREQNRRVAIRVIGK